MSHMHPFKHTSLHCCVIEGVAIAPAEGYATFRWAGGSRARNFNSAKTNAANKATLVARMTDDPIGVMNAKLPLDSGIVDTLAAF